jgi:hypothetical protein
MNALTLRHAHTVPAIVANTGEDAADDQATHVAAIKGLPGSVHNLLGVKSSTMLRPPATLIYNKTKGLSFTKGFLRG